MVDGEVSSAQAYAEPTLTSLLPTNIATLVLLPDARLGGVLDALADRLALVDATILATVPEVLSPPVVARLYEPNLGSREPGRVDGSWLGRLTFSRGQCVVLLLRSGAGFEDFAQLLASWKGGSSPVGRSPGALRSVAAFSNRCMSIVHTPDDRRQTAQTARLFLHERLLSEVLAETKPSQLSWRLLGLLMTPALPRCDVSPRMFLGAVLVRALATLAMDSRLDPLWTSAEILEEQLVTLHSGRLDLIELAVPEPHRVRARCEVRDPLAAALQARLVHHRRELADLVTLICCGCRGGIFAYHAARVLRENSVITEDWEEHMLLTTLTFPG